MSAQSDTTHTARGDADDDRVVLPSIAIVDRTITAARRTVLLSLLGAGVFVGLVMAERVWLVQSQTRMATELARAERTAGAILLADERLTMSAKMATASGDAAWIARYDRHLPDIDAAIAQAMATAPAEVATRFDQETRQANDKLVALELYAFEAVRAADLPRAADALNSQAYSKEKAVLVAGTERFTQAMVGAAKDEMSKLRKRADLALAVLALLGLGGGVWMWRRLGASLDRSRGYFVDAQSVACNDLLTGVANRVSLRDTLNALSATVDGQHRPLALLMIDLDRFKPVNDRLGHPVGDQVLTEVAQRMTRVLRQGELVARWGGDEFVVVVPNCSDTHAITAMAERLVRAVSVPMVINGHAVEIGATVGAARYPEDAVVMDELLQRADQALYRAKELRRGSICIWDADMRHKGPPTAGAEEALRRAISQGQIVPHYQPIVALADRRVIGLEILSRWQHPERGLLGPADFIALAESSGCVEALTLSVLRQACIDARAFDSGLRLSLNVTAAQLEDMSLASELLSVLHDTGFDPRRLEIELTEHALVRDIALARRVISELSDAGMTIALDDFGTGYSSLAYLSELAVDKLKIDRSFVHTLHERATSAKIVAAIIGLSRSLGVEVIAEGVETEREARALQEMGCGAAQGYLFGKPMSAAAVQSGGCRQAAVAALPAAALA